MNPSEEPFRIREIWPPGTVIKGDFSIQRKLGGGGFGTVYLAQHRFLNTTHVIKRLHEHYASDPEYVRKFVTEARAVRRLKDCPNVVEVEHMTQSEDGHLILVMEHIPGGDLAGLMESRHLAVDEVIEYARQIATGLAAAHAAGLVHRDIKPHNVMISHNSSGKLVLKLIDFGIVADHLSQQQTSVMRGGSIGYAAPEQWVKAGKELDGRTDLYSLGASMYRMLCGRMPYEADDVYTWIEQVKKGPPIAPSLLRQDVPPALSDLILELLSLRPEGRPADAATVIHRLDSVRLRSATVHEVQAKTMLQEVVNRPATSVPVTPRPAARPAERPPDRPISTPVNRPQDPPPPARGALTQPEVDYPYRPPAAENPKWPIWSGVGAFAVVLSISLWFATGNKDPQPEQVKHDAPPPVVSTQPPATTKQVERSKPKPQPQQEEPRPEPVARRQPPTTPVEEKPQEPIRQQQTAPAPKPEPVVDHAGLGDSALNAGDYRTALSHYKTLNDASRLARLQRAVESDSDERVTAMLDKGQYAEALRLVDGWWPRDFPDSRRLQALRTKIVYARDHQ